MSDNESAEQLEYFIAHVRLILDGTTMQGLDVWAQRFSELRQISEFDLCQRLANAIRSADLPEHALGVVRYGEGWLYDRMGKWPEAVKAYEASLAAFRRASIPLDATLLMQIGSIHQDQGDWPKARDAYQAAVTAAADDPHGLGLAHNNLGGLALISDDLTAAEQHYAEARDLLRDRDKRNFAAATHGLAGVHRDQGRLQEAQDLDVECLATFQALADMNGVAAAVGGIALTHLYAGQPQVAIHNLEIALQISLDGKDHVAVNRTLSNLAIAYQELSEHGTALDYLHQAIDGYREVQDRHGESVALVNLARFLFANGDTVAAAQARDVARAMCERYGFLQELRRLPPELH